MGIWKSSRPRQSGCNLGFTEPNGLKFSGALKIELIYAVTNFQPLWMIIATFRTRKLGGPFFMGHPVHYKPFARWINFLWRKEKELIEKEKSVFSIQFDFRPSLVFFSTQNWNWNFNTLHSRITSTEPAKNKLSSEKYRTMVHAVLICWTYDSIRCVWFDLVSYADSVGPAHVITLWDPLNFLVARGREFGGTGIVFCLSEDSLNNGPAMLSVG